jgi:hypothetical protein
VTPPDRPGVDFLKFHFGRKNSGQCAAKRRFKC